MQKWIEGVQVAIELAYLVMVTIVFSDMAYDGWEVGGWVWGFVCFLLWGAATSWTWPTLTAFMSTLVNNEGDDK